MFGAHFLAASYNLNEVLILSINTRWTAIEFSVLNEWSIHTEIDTRNDQVFTRKFHHNITHSLAS